MLSSRGLNCFADAFLAARHGRRLFHGYASRYVAGSPIGVPNGRLSADILGDFVVRGRHSFYLNRLTRTVYIIDHFRHVSTRRK